MPHINIYIKPVIQKSPYFYNFYNLSYSYWNITTTKPCLTIFTGPSPTNTPASISTTVSTDLTQTRLKRLPDIQLPGWKYEIDDMTVVSQDMLLVSNNSIFCVQLLDCLKGEVLDKVQLQGFPCRMSDWQEHSSSADGR